MSADNWATCPRCRENLLKKADDLEGFVEDRYGKVSMEDWLELQREAKQLRSDTFMDEHYDLREDYETYMDHEGWVHISYRAHCTKCELKYKFEHSEKVVW